jgi:hypothetical protein
MVKLRAVLSSYPSSFAYDYGYDDGYDDGYDYGIPYFMRVPRLRCPAGRLASSACISFRAGRATVVAKAARRAAPAEP